jgi:predicted nuclease of predicted toxin-antitoxin system
MNLAPRWADYLTTNGFEAEHWSNIGTPEATDLEIMQYAKRTDSVVLTNDLDFSAILATTGGYKPSVAQIRANDVRPETIGKQVVDALLQAAEELNSGALVTVLPSLSKVRILPLLNTNAKQQ